MQTTSLRDLAKCDFINGIKGKVDMAGFTVVTPKTGKRVMKRDEIIDAIENLPPDRLGRRYVALPVFSNDILVILPGRLASLTHQQKVLNIPVAVCLDGFMSPYGITTELTPDGIRLGKRLAA